MLNDKDEVLLARHVYRNDRVWGPPGGIIHYREGLPEALCREVYEETGLHIEVGPLLLVGVSTVWPHMSFHFLCSIQGSPQPRVNGELFEADFYPLDALPGPLDPDLEELLVYALQVSKQPEKMLTTRIVESDH